MDPAPRLMDPLLGLLAPRALASPRGAAILYGILATSTSLVMAAWEGRLVDSTPISWGHHQLIVHPFLSNISTLLDFAILNPLVIFFLLRSRRIIVTTPALAGSDTRADRTVQTFAALCCVALSVVLMAAYSHSFLYGNFFDAIVTMSSDGRSFITATGWVVLVWTGLFTYLLLMGAINQVRYVARVCSLECADLAYDPMHEDGAAGLRVFARPAIEVTWASAVLLVIGTVFWIYDRIMTKAALTDRTASILIFFAIVFPLFAIPIGRLHVLMLECREGLLRSILGSDARRTRLRTLSLRIRRQNARSLRDLADELETTEKLRATVSSFPSWPIPMRTLVSCGAYFAGMAAPAFNKLLPLISAALGFSK